MIPSLRTNLHFLECDTLLSHPFLHLHIHPHTHRLAHLLTYNHAAL